MVDLFFTCGGKNFGRNRGRIRRGREGNQENYDEGENIGSGNNINDDWGERCISIIVTAFFQTDTAFSFLNLRAPYFGSIT